MLFLNSSFLKAASIVTDFQSPPGTSCQLSPDPFRCAMIAVHSSHELCSNHRVWNFSFLKQSALYSFALSFVPTIIFLCIIVISEDTPHKGWRPHVSGLMFAVLFFGDSDCACEWSLSGGQPILLSLSPVTNRIPCYNGVLPVELSETFLFLPSSPFPFVRSCQRRVSP